MNDLSDNEVLAYAYAVKYDGIDYTDKGIILSQHRTRRRVPNGYYFKDTGRYIYISTFYSEYFQHKKKLVRFIVNTVTKEWKPYEITIVKKHEPMKISGTINECNELKR